MRFAIPTLLLAASPALAQEQPVLNVYTYDSFVTEWGPGPVIEAEFEKTCGCDVTFVTAGDGAALLAGLERLVTSGVLSECLLPMLWRDTGLRPEDFEAVVTMLEEAGVHYMFAVARATGASEGRGRGGYV